VKRLEILGAVFQIKPWFIPVPERFQLPECFLRPAGVVPEIGRAGAFLKFFYASAEVSVFKDASRFRGFGFLIQLQARQVQSIAYLPHDFRLLTI